MKQTLRALVPRSVACYCWPGSTGLLALTFDDGPIPGRTEQLARTLCERGHAGTFFVEGMKAERCPDVLRTIRECGSEIANHSYSHAWLSRFSQRQIASEIARTDAIIRAVQPGTRPRLRPPFGEISWPLLWFMLMRRRGLTMWTHIGGSTGFIGDQTKSSNEVYEEFRAMPLRDGDIVLFHDWCPGTGEALPRILDHLENKRMRSVTLTVLCGR